MFWGRGWSASAPPCTCRSGAATSVLIDRHELAGEETSYGNGGLIESASVFPYMFPRDLRQILQYASNRAPQVRYHFSDLPAFLPWLVRYFLASSPERALHSAMAELPLIQRSLIEHEALIAEANVPELLRRGGWIKLYRSDATLAKAVQDLERARQYGVAGDVLDAAAIAAREPNLTGDFAGGVHFPDPGFVPDPGGLAKAYAALFGRKGGRFLVGDARTLEQAGGRWRVATLEGTITAREVVVAMGPWSDQIFAPARLFDPAQRQARLSSASEAARQRRAQSSGAGLGSGLSAGADEPRHPPHHRRRVRPPRCAADPGPDRAGRCRRRISCFRLGEPVDAQPWKGARPCLPDMLPVIGKAPRHPGLWFDFGHQHHGLTLGPATGRLLAEMMTGETPFADTAPFAVERFG